MTDMNTGHRDFDADSDALMGRSGDANDANDATGARTGGVGAKVRELAGNAQQQAASQVRSKLDDGKTRAAGALRDAAEAITSPDAEGVDAVSRYMRNASDQVRRAADYLETRDVREMMNDAERLARRQPALFLGGSFVLGLLAARVLKSSRDEDAGTNRLYDRERSIHSYREPNSQYGGAGIGASGVAMGAGGGSLDNSTLGDAESNDSAPDFSGTGGSSGRYSGSEIDRGSTGTSASDSYADE